MASPLLASVAVDDEQACGPFAGVGMSAGAVALFATSTGIVATSLYYAQPLLAVIGADLGIPTTHAGILVTLSQLGYASGNLLIVPLGDMVDRRRMMVTMLVGMTLSLVLAAISPTFVVLTAAHLAIGICASVIMVLMSYVATHSREAERGRNVGRVMMGLLLGILLARTVAGFGVALVGWRAVFGVAAVVIAALVLALRATMVSEPSRPAQRYSRLILSLGTLVRSYPVLRRRSLYAFLAMGSFSAAWTGLTFLLSAPPFGYSAATIGMFGVIGAAGALTSGAIGRVGDRGRAPQATGVLAILLLVSWAAMGAGPMHLALLVGGLLLLDAAGPGLQVVHQSVIYRLDPGARARITAIFITSSFCGMATGSALASVAFRNLQWPGVCLAGALPAAVLVLLHLIDSGRTTQRPG